MNKRHYEHTLPNIRGSLSNTYGTSIIYRCLTVKKPPSVSSAAFFFLFRIKILNLSLSLQRHFKLLIYIVL